MGWSCKTEKYTKEEILADMGANAKGVEVLKYRKIGVTAWALLRVDAEAVERNAGLKADFVPDADGSISFITLALVRSHRGGDAYRHCIKLMDETSGPSYNTCPVSFINAASALTDNGNRYEWRAANIAAADKKKKAKPFKVGEVFEWDEPLEYTNGVKVKGGTVQGRLRRGRTQKYLVAPSGLYSLRGLTSRPRKTIQQ